MRPTSQPWQMGWWNAPPKRSRAHTGARSSVAEAGEPAPLVRMMRNQGPLAKVGIPWVRYARFQVLAGLGQYCWAPTRSSVVESTMCSGG